MLKAKLLAMCVCPVLATPPAILAVHLPARHAVAHLLRRVAHRLDASAKPDTPAAVAVPCTPVVAGGGAVPVGGLGDLAGGTGIVPVWSPTLAGSPISGYTGVDNFGGGNVGGGGYTGGNVGDGGGFGGPSGGPSGPAGGSSGGAISPVSPPGLPVPGTPTAGLLPIGPVTQISGAPEPTTWLFLVVGFGLVGALVRTTRRPMAAAGPAGRRPVAAAGTAGAN